MAEMTQRTTYPRVAPGRVLARHTNNEPRDRYVHPRSPDLPASFAVVPLPGDKPAMPTQDGVGRNYACDFIEDPPADGLASPRESSTLVIGQSNGLAVALRRDRDTSVAEVCRTLGVSRSTLYRHLAESEAS